MNKIKKMWNKVCRFITKLLTKKNIKKRAVLEKVNTKGKKWCKVKSTKKRK